MSSAEDTRNQSEGLTHIAECAEWLAKSCLGRTLAVNESALGQSAGSKRAARQPVTERPQRSPQSPPPPPPPPAHGTDSSQYVLIAIRGMMHGKER